MTARLTIRRAQVDGDVVDVVVHDGKVAAITEPGCAHGDEIVDADGGALVPGLHDHHIHLLALAAAQRSTTCGPPAITSRRQLTATLRAAGRSAPQGSWLRGVGYHESVAGNLDREHLDTIVSGRPCRVQHRSGHAWFLNGAALAAAQITTGPFPDGVELDAAGRPTGRIYGLDEWLGHRLPPVDVDLAAVGALLADFGVTAVTDATPVCDAGALTPLVTASGRGELGQRVVVTGAPSLPTTAAGHLERGPVKIVLADHQLPSLDDVVGAIKAARAQRRRVAVHCVTRSALFLALAAWDDVGAEPGDRIEHGAVIPLDVIAGIVRHQLTVVTQPVFVATRGDDYLADVDDDDRRDLWRCASLTAAGVPVGFGTDAPYGDPDPWVSIAAAVERRTPTGAVLGPGERLPARAALDRFLTPMEDPGGRPRRIHVGAPADLCLLDVPIDTALALPSSSHVRLTMRAGATLTR